MTTEDPGQTGDATSMVPVHELQAVKSENDHLENDIDHLKETNAALQERMKALEAQLKLAKLQGQTSSSEGVPIDQFPAEIQEMIAVKTFRQRQGFSIFHLQALVKNGKEEKEETVLRLRYSDRVRYLPQILRGNAFNLYALEEVKSQMEEMASRDA